MNAVGCCAAKRIGPRSVRSTAASAITITWRARLLRIRVGAVVVAEVLEPEVQAFLREQARDEREVGLAVLGAQAALAQLGQRVVADLQPPLRGGVVGEDVLDDLQRGLVLEHERVVAQREPREPRAHRQPVAREAAVAAQLRGLRDVAVPRRVAAVGALQADGHLLAEQLLQLELRRRGHAIEHQLERLAHRLAHHHVFGQQRQRGQRGAHLEQAFAVAEQRGEVQARRQLAQGFEERTHGNVMVT